MALKKIHTIQLNADSSYKDWTISCSVMVFMVRINEIYSCFMHKWLRDAIYFH